MAQDLDTRTIVVTNTYTIGDVHGDGAGGIVGASAGKSGKCDISNCYTSGHVYGNNAGAIAGELAGFDGSMIIINSFTTGDICGGNRSGLICGSGAGQSGFCNIENCCTQGDICGNYSGGIAGADAGKDGSFNVINIFTLGSVTGTSSGGILGSNAGNNGEVVMQNIYALGMNDGSGTYSIWAEPSGGGLDICSNSVPANLSHASELSWNDTSANYYLRSTPDEEDSTWGRQIPDSSSTPYLLKATTTGTTITTGLTTVSMVSQIFPIIEQNKAIQSLTSDALTVSMEVIPIDIPGAPTKIVTLRPVRPDSHTIAGEETIRFSNNFVVPVIPESSAVVPRVTPLVPIIVQSPIDISGLNIRILNQTTPGGDIDISGETGNNITVIPSDGGWPVTILGGNTKVTLETDLVLDVNTNYFTFATGCSAEFVGDTIIPQRIIDISGVTDWPGLFDCSSSGSTMNIGYLGVTASNGSQLVRESGWVVGINAGQDGSCNIYNCYSTGDIDSNYTGGIAGYGAGRFNGSCNIYNCFSTGDIGSGDGYYQGGIVGGLAGYNFGNCNIYNCYSTGTIGNGSYYQGGIAGGTAGRFLW